MAIRREILLIVALLILIGVLVKVVEFANTMTAGVPNASKASSFVTEDLRSKYPTASIGIMAVTPKYNDQGKQYYEVEARVTQDPASPCPQRSHIFYNYPEQNFVAQPTEVVTANCAVCTEGICNLAFPEEAIIASHTFSGTEIIQSYLRANKDAAPAVTQRGDDWLVQWNAANASASYVVEIHSNGSVLNITRLSTG
jgi:hypothetical protein